MAHFYASIKGGRSEKTACGTKNSGMSGHIRGWDIGGKVTASFNEMHDTNAIDFVLTGGSNNSESLGLSLHVCMNTKTVSLNGKNIGFIKDGKFSVVR